MQGFRFFLSATLLASLTSGHVLGQEKEKKETPTKPGNSTEKPQGESGTVAPVEPASSAPAAPPANAPAKGPITVRVYKWVNGTWLERPERKYERKTPTQADYETGGDYLERMKTAPGWTAVWDAPDWLLPSADIPTEPTTSLGSGETGKAVPDRKAYSLVGVWKSPGGFSYLFERAGAMRVFSPSSVADGTWRQSGKSISFTYRWPGTVAVHEMRGSVAKNELTLAEEFIYPSGTDRPANRLMEHRTFLRAR
jgi:hypothetical protein